MAQSRGLTPAELDEFTHYVGKKAERHITKANKYKDGPMGATDFVDDIYNDEIMKAKVCLQVLKRLASIMGD